MGTDRERQPWWRQSGMWQGMTMAVGFSQEMTSCAAWTSTTRPSPSGLKRW